MRGSLIVLVLLLVPEVSVTAAFGQAPSLNGEMAARKIVVNEENQEIAVPADKVYPQDMVEYTLRYTNSGSAPASGVNLIGPIPDGTVYLYQTATDNEKLHPLFSIDQGKSYHEAPVTYVVVNEQGVEERREATPDMITHIRWAMRDNLGVGQEVSVSYRVQVK